MRDLTIEELAELCQREMASRDLEKLADGFLQDACKLLENLKVEAQRKEGLEKKLAERQLSEAMNLLKLLFSMRVTKAVILFLAGRTSSNLLEVERSKFSEIERLLKELKEFPIPEEELMIKIPGGCVRKLVVFRLSVPQKIVGADGKIYGPFDAGDIANLPVENAELLVKHGFADELSPA